MFQGRMVSFGMRANPGGKVIRSEWPMTLDRDGGAFTREQSFGLLGSMR